MVRAPSAGSVSGDEVAANAAESLQSAFAGLRQTACRDLTAVTARLGQRYSQAAADYRRTMMAVQTEVQNAQEAVARDYMDAMQAAAGGGDVSEAVQRCNRAMDEARKAARSRAEGSAEEARRAIDKDIGEANAAWDAACADYIAALQGRVARFDPASPDPVELAGVAEGLGWIAMRVKRKEPG